MLDRFDYASYRELLARLGRESRNLLFSEVAPDDDGFFLLRHDVDYSPTSALRMAELEAELGCRATYFVLLSSPYYNVLSEEHRTFARRLVELGHEVGLHYDVAVLEAVEPPDPMRLLELQADLLGTLCGAPIKAISMHNPSISGRDPFSGTDTFINVYDPRYTRAIRYLSDSCGAWRDEAATALAAPELPTRLQLLVHPIFWDDRSLDRWGRLDVFTTERILDLQAMKEKVRADWLAHSGVLEHDRRNAVDPAAALPRQVSEASGDLGG